MVSQFSPPRPRWPAAERPEHPAGDPAVGVSPQAGFTIVEVIVAIVILAVGLMGMAGTTALVVRQVTLADVATQRAAALQSTIENLRATPFDNLVDGSDSVGVFDVSWSVTNPDGQWASVEIVTTGPGLTSAQGEFPILSPSVPDTFTYRILR